MPEAEVHNELRRWKQRRKLPLNDAAIFQTIRELHILGWIDVELDSTSMFEEDDLLQVV